VTLVDEAAIWAEAQDLSHGRLNENAAIYQHAAALEGPIRRMYQRLEAREASP